MIQPSAYSALKEIIDGLPVAAILADLDGVTLESNAAAQLLFGPSATRGSPQLGRRHWYQQLARAVRKGDSTRSLVLRRRAGDRTGNARVRITAIAVQGAGSSRGLLLIAGRSDDLRNDARYSALLDTLLEPIAVHVDARIVYANQAFATLFGVNGPDDLIGMSIIDFVHPDYRTIVSERMSRVNKGGVADLIEEKIIDANGAILDVEVRAVPVHYNGRDATQVVVRDITRSKQMEAGLLASQQRYRILTESVRDYAVVALDCDGIIVSWNAAAALITGFSADEMVGSSLGGLFSNGKEEPADIVRHLFDVATTDGRFEAELWARHKASGDYWAGVIVNAMRDPNGAVVGFTAVLHDLSRQREIEARLRRSEEQLRQSQKMDAIGRLAAGIAHDFKNLITAIHGHAQFLLEDLPSGSDLRTDAIEIKRSADRASDLTRQLLTFARKQEVEKREIDVNEVVRNLEKMLRRLIRADLNLVTQLAPNLPGVLADRGQVEQVIMNLVVNARDAIPGDGTITIMTSTLDLDERYTAGALDVAPGRYVLINVTDNGVGMDAETQHHMFEPFFTTKRDGEGTGLGLATVYGIVRQAGGHISVYSEPAKGSTIKVFLPVVHAARTPAQANESAKPQGADAGKGETVLVVEDDDAIRSLAIRILRARGYPVLSAENASAAIATAEAHEGKIDLLLTDLTMPGLSGEELAVRIRKLCPGIAVMFMSGYSEPTQNDAAHAQDATFLEKPFGPEELARGVAEALRRAS